jgi:hypothetical protein
MLDALENFLVQAIRPALPQGLNLIAGPTAPPATGQQVNLIAALRVLAACDASKRDPAYFVQAWPFSGDGQQRDFPLPAEAAGELQEVQFGSGHLASRGDEYWLESRQLRFYRAPQGPFQALLRGPKAQGYQEIQPCRIDLEIQAWAAQAAADALLAPALAAVLSVFAKQDALELARLSAPSFSLRLLKPTAGLQRLDHEASGMEGKMVRASAYLKIQGELELALALGVAAPEGVILSIENRLEIAGPAP